MSMKSQNDYCIIVGIDYGKYRFFCSRCEEDERMRNLLMKILVNILFFKDGSSWNI